MTRPDPGDWEPMATAPRDGTRILVALRASEQGPAEVDVVRWAKAGPADDAGWIATDSDSGARFVYAETELMSWMDLPTPLPKLRRARSRTASADEIDGSAI